MTKLEDRRFIASNPKASSPNPSFTNTYTRYPLHPTHCLQAMTKLADYGFIASNPKAAHSISFCKHPTPPPPTPTRP